LTANASILVPLPLASEKGPFAVFLEKLPLAFEDQPVALLML
jgi:hypothetical protein